jgi:hypothetical protein
MNELARRRSSALAPSFVPIWLAVALLLTSAGCAKKAPPAAPAAYQTQALRFVPPAGSQGSSSEPGEHDPSKELKLLRTGHLELEVASVEHAIDSLRELAAQSGAIVAGSEVRRHESGASSGSVTLKVPASGFDGSWRALKALGKVRNERISTEDVTKAYFDLETRLAVKRRTEERLRQLLTSATGKLSEILEVERELDRVVVEIEQLLGEKRFYDERLALSTIVVELSEPLAIVRASAVQPIVDALREAAEVLAESVAVLILAVTAALPWILLLAILIGLFRRARRRRRMAEAE